MKRSLIFIALTLLLHLWVPVNGLGLLIGLFFTFKQLKGYRKQTALILILLLIRFQFQITPHMIKNGRIVELNASSVVIMQGVTKVLVKTNHPLDFGLGDTLRVSDLTEIRGDLSTYGFDSGEWAKANGIRYETSSIVAHDPGSGFLHWISLGGHNGNRDYIELMRSILFQARSETFFALAVSSGILFTTIFKLLRTILKPWVHENVVNGVLILVFVYLGYGMGWPLALQRIGIFSLCNDLIEDPFQRFSMKVILMVILNPFAMTQMSWALPLGMELAGLFGTKGKSKLQGTLTMSWILSAFNLRFHWLEILCYPWIRKFYVFMILFVMVGYLSPAMNPYILESTRLFDLLLSLVRQTGFQNGRMTLVGAMMLCLWFMAIKAMSIWKWQIGLIVITLILIPISAYPWLYQVNLINVGQGDSILIQSPFNQSVVLIDTGAGFAYPRLKSFLDAQGIKVLDALILSHSDSDHSANRDQLTKDYEIHSIVTFPKDIRLADLTLQAFPLNIRSEDENDTSLVYGLNLHGTRFLFLADIPVTSEKVLLEHYPGLKADIVKIAHHGSKTSTSDELLGNLEAKIAWISVGANLYGHPSKSVLKRLSAFRLKMLSTLWEGDIQTLISPFFRVFVTSSGRLIFF